MKKRTNYDTTFFGAIGTEIKSAINRMLPSKEKNNKPALVSERSKNRKKRKKDSTIFDVSGAFGKHTSLFERTGEFGRFHPNFDEDEDEGIIYRGGTEELPIVTIEAGLPTLLKFARRTDEIVDYCRLEIDKARIMDGERIYFTYKDCECELICNEATRVVCEGDTVSNIIFTRPDTYYRTEKDSEAFPCVCIFAMDDEHYRLFDCEIDMDEKKDLLAAYCGLSHAQRKHVFSLATRPAAGKVQESSSIKDIFTPIRDEKSLDMMFRICKNTYPSSVIARAEILREQLEHCSASERNDILTQLAYTLGIDTTAHYTPSKTYEDYKAIMDRHIYGMEEFKQAIIEFIIAMKASGASYLSMLLVGPPGVGKTSVCEAVAECLGVEIVNIDCSGVDSITLSGLVRSYGGAKPGKVLEGLFNAGKTDVLLRLDELDKMAKGKEGDPYSGLIKPLGPQRSYYDEYVASDTDVSATKFIATSNNIENIPGYILSRFENCIFHISPYTEDEKLEIAKNHIIPKRLAEFGLSADECVFDDSAIRVMIKEFTGDEGVRELEGNIIKLLRKLITAHCRGIIEKPFHIDEKYAKDCLAKIKIHCQSARIGFAS